MRLISKEAKERDIAEALVASDKDNHPVIFDGTTRLGEAFAIVLCFVDEELCIQQRLVRMQLLSKSMSGEEIARELIDTLSVHHPECFWQLSMIAPQPIM